MITPKTKLGKFIRKRRRKLGLSAVELSKEAGMSKKTIYGYERSNRRVNGSQMSHDRICKLAKALKCTDAKIESLLPKRKVISSKKVPISEFGKFIRKNRMAAGLSGKELAGKLNLSYELFGLYERGSERNNGSAMSLELKQKFAKELKCTVADIDALLPKQKNVKIMSEPLSDLGKLLLSKRRELNISQFQFCSRANIILKTFVGMERGIVTTISFEHAKRLESVFNIPFSKLKPYISIETESPLPPKPKETSLIQCRKFSWSKYRHHEKVH